MQGGTGVTVGGAGTPGNPYVISVDSSALQVQDTNSVDMTLTGSGTQGDPHVIRSDVIRDPAADNILTIGPNGVGVSCEAVQDCVGAGFQQDGGLAYDDVNNLYYVLISSDPGNTTNFGTDGGIFTPSSPVTLGCGLEFGAFGEIQANVQDFDDLTRRNCDDDSDVAGTSPLPGPDTAGMAVYCGADGNLRTMPEKFTEVAGANISEGFAPGITALPFTTSAISMTLTNPSSQYCMCGYAVFAIIPGISGDAGTVVAINHEIDFGTGGGFVAQTGSVMDNRGKNASSGALGRPEFSVPICLDPGETKVIQHRVRFVRFTGDNGGNVLITSAARSIRWVGTNL